MSVNLIMEESDKICPFCNETFAENLIKSHIATLHLAIKPKELEAQNSKDKNTIRCSCGIEFTNRKSLQRHTQRKHRGWKYQCDNCGISYNDKSRYKGTQRFARTSHFDY